MYGSRRLFLHILVGSLAFSLSCLAVAQSQPDSTKQGRIEQVRFVEQFPLPPGEALKPGLLRRVSSFFIGKEKPFLHRPMAVCGTSPNHFWILDQESGKLISVEQDKPSYPRAIERMGEPFPSLVGMCLGPGEAILFTDSRLNKIYLYHVDEDRLQSLGDSLDFIRPTGIAYAPDRHEIWVTESGAHRICVLNEEGELIRYIGGRGNGPGQFNFPTDICFDATGKVYVIDAMNFRIQMLDTVGAFIGSFGEAGDASGYFARAKGIAIDSYGNIYITDALFHTVQIFDPQGKLLYYFGSQGHGEGQFWMPAGIWIDQNDYIYIADKYNARIQIFQLLNPRPLHE